MAKSRDEIKKDLRSGSIGGSVNESKSKSRDDIKRDLITRTSEYSRARNDVYNSYNKAIESVGRAYGQYSTAGELSKYGNDIAKARDSANLFNTQYGKYINDTERKSLNDMSKWYDSVLEGTKDYVSLESLGQLYGQYQNADAYNKARAKQEWANANKGLTYKEVKKRKKNATGDELEYLNEYGTLVGYDNLDDYDSELADLEQNPLNSKGAQIYTKNPKAWSVITGKSLNITKDDVDKIQNYSKELEKKRNLYENEHKADKYADLVNNDDYAELSKYNAEKGYMLTTGLGGEYWNWKQASFVDKGFSGMYEAINERGDFTQTDDFAMYMEDAYARINEDNYKNLSQNSPLLYMATDQMTYKERETFNYLYSKSKADAYNYLKDMHKVWQKRKNKSQEEDIENFSDKGFGANAALTVGRIVAQPFANATSALNLVGGAISGEYNPYNDSAYLKNFTDKAESTVGSAISEATGNPQWAENLGVDLPSFLYSTGLSTVDSIIGGEIFGPGYAVVMGTGAFQTTAKQMADEGYSSDDIWVKAGIAGLAEVITEYISLENLDKLIKNGGIDGIKSVLKSSLKQMAYEGSEEIASELVNHMADELYMGGASEIKNKVKAYMEQGYSEEEAQKKAYQEFAIQVAESGIGGAISGFAMGLGVGGAEYSETKNRGRKLRDNNNLQYINEAASNVEQDSEAKRYFDQVSRYSNDISKASDAQIANAYDKLVLQLMTEKDGNVRMDVENSLVENGFDRAEANKVTSAILEFIKNDNKTDGLSKETIKVLSQDNVLEYINKLFNNEVSINYNLNSDITMSTLERANEKNLNVENLSEVRKTDDGYVVTDSEGNTETYKSGDIDREQSRLLRYASDYEGDLNKLFVEGYNKNYTASDYAMAFELAYRSGLEGEQSRIAEDTAVAKILGSENALKVYQTGYNQTIENAKATAQSADEFANNLKAENIIKGSFVSEVDYSKLTSRKKIAYKIAQAFANMGINVEVFDDPSSASKNGEFIPGENRTDDKVRINLSARFYADQMTSTTGYVVSTMSHELTHWLEVNAKEQYDVLSNIVKENLQKEGLWDKFFQEEYNKAIKNGQDAYHASKTAESEVIARACEDMLNDTGKMAEYLSKGTEAEVTGLKKAILKFFRTFKSLIQKLLNGSKSYSAEAQALKNMEGVIDQMREAWAEAFNVALANIQEQRQNISVEEQAEVMSDIDIDSDTGTVVSSLDSAKHTLSQDWKALGYKSYEQCIDEVANDINEKSGINDLEKVKRWIMSEESVAAFILREENAEFLDYHADDRYDAVKKNSDYAQGTVDLSNLCRKREIFTRMFDNLQRQNPGVLFTADNIATIRQVLAEEHFEVACALCYVEDRRQRMGEIAGEFIDEYKKALASDSKLLTKINSKKQVVPLMPTKIQQTKYGISGSQFKATDDYVPTQYDLVTYEGFKALQENHPNIAYAFERFNNSRGMQSARVIEGHAEYKREILKWTPSQIEKANNLGGMRIFSFSDFEAIHLIDICQVLQDCAKMGVKIQTYTKVPEFAYLARNTRAKINRSLIPANVGSKNAYARILNTDGTYKFVKVQPYEDGIAKYNGEDVLAFDTVEGINANSEYFFDSTSNPNVGNILIGLSDKQIKIAMTDPFVDYIIPFHTGQKESVLHAKGIGRWKNYKDYQVEKKNGKGVKKGINIYTLLKGGDITNKQEFMDRFLKACDKGGLVPRFDDFIDRDSKGNRVYTEGYWKLLIDFKLFDQNGNILPQETIVPDIDTDLATKILTDGAKEIKNSKFPQKVMNKVADRLAQQGTVLEKFSNALSSEKVKSEFDIDNPIEQTDKLVAIHNLTGTQLLWCLENGGFPSPSIAIIKESMNHTMYGETSVVLYKDSIDPKANKKNKVYGSDAYTPSVEGVGNEIKQKEFFEFKDKLNGYLENEDKMYSDELVNFTGLYNDDSSPWDLGQAIDRFWDNVGLRASYLKSIGKDISPVTTFNNPNLGFETDKIDLYEKFIEELPKAAIRTSVLTTLDEWKQYHNIDNAIDIVDKMIGFKFKGKSIKESFVFSRLKEAFYYSQYKKENGDSIASSVESVDEIETKVKLSKMISEISDDYEAWLSEEFSKFIGDKGIRNDKDAYTNNGRRTFKQRYDAFTPENIVKAMFRNQKERGGHTRYTNTTGINSIASTDFKSIDEIKKEADRLELLPQAQYDEILEEYNVLLDDIIDTISNDYLDGRYPSTMIEEAFEKSAKGNYSVRVVKNAFKTSLDIDLDDEHAEAISKLIDDIAHMPTGYFEAKPQRVVGIDEIAKVIIPEDASDKLVKALNDRGISYEEYNPFSDDSRKDALNRVVETSNVLFSDKVKLDDYLNQTERYNAENETFKADGNNLMSYIGTISDKSKMLTDRNVELVANAILDKANSTYSKSDLMTEIRNVMTNIAQASDDMGNFDSNWNNINAELESIASNVISKGRDKSDIDPYYRRILKDYRAMRVALNPDESNYARHTYGTAAKNLNDYRNAFMGKVILTQDGMTLNEAWAKLSKEVPEMFDASATLEQKVDGLITGYNAIKDAAEVVRNFHETESIREMAQTIYEKVWNVATKYTDDGSDAVKDARDNHRKSMAEITKSRGEALPNPTGTYLKIIKDIRDKNNQRFKDLKNQIERRKQLDRSRAEKQKVIRNIENNCDKLRTWLSSNDAKHHVVQPLQEPVRELLFALDFSSKQSLGIDRDGNPSKGKNRGRMTRKDVSLVKAMESVRAVVDETLKAQVDFSAMYDFPQDMLDIVDLSLEAIRQLSAITDNELKTTNMQYNNAMVINKLDLSTLEYLDTIVSIMTKTVRNANNLLASRNAHSVDYIAVDMIKDALSKGERWTAHNGIVNAVDRFVNFQQMTPYYFFKHIAGQKIFTEIMDGWDAYAFHIRDIVDFAEKTWTAQQYGEWSEQIHRFTIQERQTEEQELNGEEGNKVDIEITTSQLMSLHCLLKREQAVGHIKGYGIKISGFNANGREAGNRKTTLTMDEAYRMVSELTPEQKNVADAIQHFMSTTCADWGNEISRKRFGIDAFTEENYFPIQVDSNALNKEAKETTAQSIYRLLNMSFTKKPIEKAKNMIVIDDIFDVFANHSTDMAKYNTLALPTLDLIKVLNYKEIRRTSGSQVQADTLRDALDTAYGKGKAVHYINQFLTDLNGSQVADDNQILKMLLRNSKMAAVGANFQVALLQPLSYLRASYVLDPRYLARGVARRPQGHYEGTGKDRHFVWKHQEECGISLWKSLGFYDVNANIGVSTMIKQNKTVPDNIREKSMIGAEHLDSVTWAVIYNACEEWANDTIGANANNYRQKVNDKFREVCYATQVFDSTVSRSEIMRSKSYAWQISTSFGSEPTLGFNMLYDAVNGLISDYRKTHNFGEALRKNRANILRAFGTYALGAIVESALRAGITLLRKPDTEETYGELFLSHFLDEINPLTKIPIIKDFISYCEGYSVSRLEYGGFDNFTQALRGFAKQVQNDRFIFGNWKSDFKMLQALSQFAGVPVSGMTKDVITLWNTIVRVLGYDNLIVKM